jgi:hypothetical protein
MPVTTRSRARQLRPNCKPVGFYAEPDVFVGRSASQSLKPQPGIEVDEEMYEAAAILLTLSKGSPLRRSARLAQQQQQQRLLQPSV